MKITMEYGSSHAPIITCDKQCIVLQPGEVLFTSAGAHDRFGVFWDGLIRQVILRTTGEVVTTEDALLNWNKALHAGRLTRYEPKD